MASRLFLRPWASQSAHALFAALSAPALYNLDSYPPPLDVGEFIERHDPRFREGILTYCAHLAVEPGTPIGLTVFQSLYDSACDIGFMLSRTHWGHGLGKEMVDLALIELTKRGTPMSVSARVDERNTSSIRVLEKCGFAYVKREETMLKRAASVDLLFCRNV